jgi:predicted PurR-regulated permease PerM
MPAPPLATRIDNVPRQSAAQDREAANLLSERIASAGTGIWICAGLLSVYTLYIGRNLFVPITVAVFAYLTVRPLIRFASHLGIPAFVTATGIMLSLVVVVGGGGYMVSGPAQVMLEQVPDSMKDAKAKLAFVFDKLETVNEATADISQTADAESVSQEDKPVPVQIEQPAWTTSSPLIAGTGNAMSFLSIAGVLLFFLMAAVDSLISSIMSNLPTFASKRRFVEILESVQDGLSRYLAWVTAINFCLGVAIAFAMWMLGMPSPIVWGVAAMLLNFIPIVGAVIGLVLVFFVALINFDHASYAFVVAKVAQHVARSHEAGVPMHLIQDSNEAAKLAIDYGLVRPEVLPTIKAATARDRNRQVGFV